MPKRLNPQLATPHERRLIAFDAAADQLSHEGSGLMMPDSASTVSSATSSHQRATEAEEQLATPATTATAPLMVRALTVTTHAASSPVLVRRRTSASVFGGNSTTMTGTEVEMRGVPSQRRGSSPSKALVSPKAAASFKPGTTSGKAHTSREEREAVDAAAGQAHKRRSSGTQKGEGRDSAALPPQHGGLTALSQDAHLRYPVARVTHGRACAGSGASTSAANTSESVFVDGTTMHNSSTTSSITSGSLRTRGHAHLPNAAERPLSSGQSNGGPSGRHDPAISLTSISQSNASSPRHAGRLGWSSSSPFREDDYGELMASSETNAAGTWSEGKGRSSPPARDKNVGIIRVPIMAALTGNIIITVVLVAALTIIPLNSVSVHAVDYVTSTMSLALVTSFTRSIEANLLGLPHAVRGFASSWLSSNYAQTWEWTEASMPDVMHHLCKNVVASGDVPSILYMSMSSPYSGYSAYCSLLYEEAFVIGNYITDNTSQPRYFVNSTSYTYTDPRAEYRGVPAMTPWEYAVDFGGSSNLWHGLVVPWYDEYTVQRSTTAAPGAVLREPHKGLHGNISSRAVSALASSFASRCEAPLQSHLNSSEVIKGYWRVFSHDTATVVTYSYPFVDRLGNPSVITGALQPAAIAAKYPNGIITSDSSGRAMVVDTLSGMVLFTSWGRSAAVQFDNWNTSSNCAPSEDEQRSLYVTDITDPLMAAALANIGGLTGIAATPRSVSRWVTTFKANKSTNLMAVSRVNITSRHSDISLVVIYVVHKAAFTDSISSVKTSALVAVGVVLIAVLVVDLVLLYLFVNPLQGVAAGLRDAAQLRDGSHNVDGVTSILAEVADMQNDFRVLNGQLMRMKTFLPQGMLGAATSRMSDGDVSATVRSSTSYALGGGDGDEEDLYDEDSRAFGRDDDGARQRSGGEDSDTGVSDDDGDLDGATARLRRRRGPRRRSDAGNLHLNERVLLEEVNRFRRRYCSVIVFCMHLLTSDVNVKFLNEHCGYFMEGVLPRVLRHGGVVELQRPDYIVVSFGAHNKVAMHQTRAAKCALEVMHWLNTSTPIGARVGCLVDASEFFVGTCGAAQRNAVVTYSHNLVPKGDLVRVLKSVQAQVLVTQKLAATLDDSMLRLPVDCISLNPLSKAETILYELRGNARMLPAGVSEVAARQVLRAVRMGFVRMLKGDYAKALDILEPYEGQEAQAVRLSAVCRAFVHRNVRRPFLRSINLLTFSETNFEGYGQGGMVRYNAAGAGSMGMSANSAAAHSATAAGGSMAVANPLSPGSGMATSPFADELDPTSAFLANPATVRLLVGAAVAPASASSEGAPGSNGRSLAANAAEEADSAARVAAVLSADAEVTEGQAACGAARSLTDVDHVVSSGTGDGEDADPGNGEDETALFEMFVMEDNDDDDAEEEEDEAHAAGGAAENGVGGGGDDGGAQRQRKVGIGELPLFFTDYQGNPWRRSYDVLGTGAFSTVYRGLSASGNLVALKCFTLNARNIDINAVVEEVRLFANLHHENVVQYLSLYASERYCIEVMEFVPGGSLDTLLKSFGSLRVDAVRRYLRDVLRGLNYLHSESIVHCDIKPHNVLLAMDGQCKVSDFGSAMARATSSASRIDDVLEMRGTPGYMSPEVARGEVPTMKSDVYSLGVTVLELLTGRLPWGYAGAVSPTPTPQPARRIERSGLLSHLGSVGPLSSAPEGRTEGAGGGKGGGGTTRMPSAISLSPGGETTPALAGTTHSSVVFGKQQLLLSMSSQSSLFTASTVNEGHTDPAASIGSASPALHSPLSPRPATTSSPLTSGHLRQGSAVDAKLPHFQRTSVAPRPDQPPLPLSTASPEVSAYGKASSLKTSEMTTSSLFPSQRRRPIEQVLRSDTQLVVYISRGWVVPQIPAFLDEDAVDFLELCLNPVPALRANAGELLRHSWLM